MNYKNRSVWNLFTPEAKVTDDIQRSLEEVKSMRKVSYTIKNGRRTNDESRRRESMFWKLGDVFSQSEGDLTHDNSPMKEFLGAMGCHMKTLAGDHVSMEIAIQGLLGPEYPLQRIIAKDYPDILKERDLLKQKLREKENLESRYQVQQQRTKNAKGDEAFEENHRLKENRLKIELENIEKDKEMANDKLLTSIYNIQASETEITENLLSIVEEYQQYYRQVSERFDTWVPQLREKIRCSKKTRIYGVDLARHISLREDGEVLSFPIQLGCDFLLDHLKTEGLFRIGPSEMKKRKMKAAIDAGVGKNDIWETYRDPHLYTEAIKSYLRELPDPLFCSEYADEWRKINKVEDELERIREIKHLLGKLPKPNRDNIEYLFKFLEKIVAEEFYNKMSVENLLVVFSPNLLWTSSGQHVPIDAVQKSMINRHGWIFDNGSNISNLLTLSVGGQNSSNHSLYCPIIEERDEPELEPEVYLRPESSNNDNNVDDVIKRSTIKRKGIRAGKMKRTGVTVDEESPRNSLQLPCVLETSKSEPTLKLERASVDVLSSRLPLPRFSRQPFLQTMARSLDADLQYVPCTEERLGQMVEKVEEELSEPDIQS